MENNTLESSIISVANLSKRYAPNLPYAISGLNFCCKNGEIVGLLGQNGAGKSTTLKCITGMLPFSEGEIIIDGFDIKTQSLNAKKTFGFVSTDDSAFLKMTGIRYVNFFADVYGVPESERMPRLEELDKVLGLGDSIYNLIGSYSHGMKQKVCMLASLIHLPKLWILDEPLLGLDPQTSIALTTFMREYAHDKGNTVIFSSHNLDMVEKICDRALIINSGKLMCTLEKDELKNLEREFLKSSIKENKDV